MLWNVFDLLFGTREGTVTNFSEVNITHNFFEVDTLNFSIPFTVENFELLQVGRILQKKGSKKAFLIHTAEIKESDNRIWGYAYGLECLLDDRILIYPRGFRNMSVEYAMHTLVDENMINADLSYRNIPNLIKSSNLNRGFLIDEDFYGTTLYELFKELSSRSGVGFKIYYEPRNNQMEFHTLVGINRTVNQTSLRPIRWVSEFQDTYDEVLTISKKEWKTNVLVVGSDEYSNLRISVGDEAGFLAGLSRKESYLSASDVTSGMQDEAGVTLTAEQINNLLKSKGRMELRNHKSISDYAFTLGQINEVYGTDYEEGDFVSVVNQTYDIVQHKQIATVQELIQGDVSTFTITFKE